MSQASRHRSHAPGAPALSWLQANPQGAHLLQTAHTLMALQSALRATLPLALQRRAQVARIEGQQLTVLVPGPAYAARLRQLTHQVASQLQQQGWPVETIVVRIDAAMGQAGTQKPLRETRPLDEQALHCFETLAKDLSPGPLSDAVSRLLRHHRPEGTPK
ncbi:MAG: DciA family protein [Castellaniella sp.]